MYIGDMFVSEKNNALVGVEFTFTVLASTSVILRIITRLWLVKSIGIDDGFIVLSMLGTLGFLISVMEQIRFGLGEPPNPELLSPFIQATTASVISYTTCHLAVKLSLTLLYLRIFDTPAARRTLICLLVYFSIYGILCLLLTILTCWPIEKYWDASIPGKCLDNRALRYAFAGINIANDLVLLIVPMPWLKTLHMQKRLKYGVMGLFAVGGVACIIAIIRLHALWAYSSVHVTQRPVKGIEIALWSGLECNIAIICACVPSLRYLLSRIFPDITASLSGSSKHLGHGSNIQESPHNNASHGDRALNPSEVSIKSQGIKMQQSFEMRTMSAGDDSNSEKNLVPSTLAVYHAEISSGTNKLRL